MSWLFPRGTRRLPPIWVDDVPESVKVEMFDMLMKEMLSRPLEYVGGFKMNDKDLMKKLSMMTNEEIEQEAKELINDGIVKEMTPNPVERKRQLMRLEKEMLVDMVFNLESRNEMLVNNLLEVEKMFTKTKEEEE